jgi:hypothetical protein
VVMQRSRLLGGWRIAAVLVHVLVGWLFGLVGSELAGFCCEGCVILCCTFEACAATACSTTRP